MNPATRISDFHSFTSRLTAFTGKLSVGLLIIFLVALSTCPTAWAVETETEAPGGVVSGVATLAGGDLYALVVGVSQYKHEGVPGLNVAAKDARDFARFLGAQDELFREVKVTLLVDAEATKREVERFLLYQLRKAGKNDTVFIFLSGHGAVDPKRPGEFSLEAPRMGNSLFTKYFLEGVKGAADKDGNGVVTIHEAYNYVYDRTKLESQGAQHPQFEGVVEGEFPLSVSSRLTSRPATELRLTVDPPGAEVFVSGRLVGKTNADGSMFLKYLPLGRPIPVSITKEGWVAKRLKPFVFSESNLSFETRPIKRKPALASLEI